jgi:hypothetical protein
VRSSVAERVELGCFRRGFVDAGRHVLEALRGRGFIDLNETGEPMRIAQPLRVSELMGEYVFEVTEAHYTPLPGIGKELTAE